MGRRVQLADGYYNNETRENNKQIMASGKIVELFGGGKSCPIFMMIDLDTPYRGFQYLQANHYINAYTTIYGLASDSLELRMVECFEPSYWPVKEPVFLKKDIYLEYE